MKTMIKKMGKTVPKMTGKELPSTVKMKGKKLGKGTRARLNTAAGKSFFGGKASR